MNRATLTAMASAFGTQFAAFCYLVFVLLYAPCVAVLGAVTKEAGLRWMVLVFAWTTTLGLALALLCRARAWRCKTGARVSRWTLRIRTMSARTSARSTRSSPAS